ncbi:peptide-methionine (S)-S-oxide reductase MsrA [Clostridium sp. 19966]|uniref:peptide-methionine (S)-S-oxide reductase MsrA n=1 Tax=Clostridium sp. 19966 TaxID=2768166 RepID=UPI0028DF0E01|nr:peptide-methionine (S)-S-oxide reductase MsrA [Clostridium sp. 19966]MDT8717569.1 peptide-methionine (S)-S-oxide reductase MsrA [Clostridium sp. 19966]
MRKIVLAGGCFWGVEAYFNTINGVINTKVGYANGNVENPTYEMVCKNTTGFSEACYIEYDEQVLSLKELLNAYWFIVDPTIENRQGHDIGTQYRTGIYFIEAEDESAIRESLEEEQKKYEKPIVTEVIPLKNFYDAEEYHQKYLDKNPNGYCHIPRELIEKKK